MSSRHAMLLAKSAIVLAAALLVLLTRDIAAAQGFPSKPVKIIVAASPGTALDVLTRLAGQELSVRLGQMFVAENVPGAGGNIATANVAKAPPDGYTLLMQVSSLVINPALYKKVPYDPIKHFQPVIMAAWAVTILAVSLSAEVNSVQELVTLAKSHPGRLNYTSPGYGTPPHLRMEIFKRLAGVDVVHVPFKTPADMIRAMYAGDVTAMFNASSWLIPQAKAGKVKLLAVLLPKRWMYAPDVPTIAEAGYPELTRGIWFGFFAPAGTPRDVVRKLNTEFASVLNSEGIRENLAKQGLVAGSSTPEEFAEMIKTDLAYWAKVIAEMGITID